MWSKGPARRILQTIVAAASVTMGIGAVASLAAEERSYGTVASQPSANGSLVPSSIGVGEFQQDRNTIGESGARLAQNPRFDGWRQYFGSRSHTITANPRGHFVTTAYIDGIAIKLLIDTGATSVVLSRDDANRLGIRARALNFSVLFSTAGGVARAAPVTLDEIQVGDFAVSNVRAFVIDTPSTISVLGIDFLSRLERYEVTGSKLILYW